MKKWIALVLAASVLAGCGDIVNFSAGNQIVGSGKVATDTRKVAAFKSVDLDGAMDVDIKIGPQSGIKIEGDDNILPHVRAIVNDGTLHLDTDAGYSTNHPLNISFSTPTLEAGSLNGSGNMTMHGCTGKSLNVEINGSGNLIADGAADTLSASLMGSGNLYLSDLKAGVAKVEINGSGNAKVNVSGTLTASVTGSGDIDYKGNPKHVAKSVTGSGRISGQ